MEQDFPENMDDFVTLDELAEDEDFDRQDSQSKHSDSGSGKRLNLTSGINDIMMTLALE